jgi:hydrogenase maturation protease
MSPTPHARLIAVGNPFWRDDGAGIAVAQRVRAAAPPGVDIVELGGDPASLLEALQDADTVVLVDAVRSGAVPSSIHRVEVGDGEQLPDRRPRDSSHGLALGDLVALARTLHRLPRRLVVIGIEAAELGPGPGLSPPVATAVETAAQQALRELTADADPDRSAGGGTASGATPAPRRAQGAACG